jgi:hypothetical protein
MIGNVNNKYKTALCNNFEQSGECRLGDRCHFAHGKEELRNVFDPLPPNKGMTRSGPKPIQNYSGGSQPPNYKTSKCRFYESGHCKYGKSCNFAHGDEELRSSTQKPKPHTPSSTGMQTSNYMMGYYDPSSQNQISQQQVFYMISLLQEYHAKDHDIMEKLKKAQELGQNGNVQAAGSLVNEITGRSNKTEEDSTKYASILQTVQYYGMTVMNQLATQSMYGYGSQPMGMMSSYQGMGMAPSYGMDSNSYQPRSYNRTNYRGNSQGGRGYGQGTQGYQNTDSHPRDETETNTTDSTNVSEVTGMMGNLQVSPSKQGSNPKSYGGKQQYQNT